MIEFSAQLKPTGKAIKVDAEMEAEVTFTCPASEIAEIVKLVGLSGKSFRVRVVEEHES